MKQISNNNQPKISLIKNIPVDSQDLNHQNIAVDNNGATTNNDLFSDLDSLTLGKAALNQDFAPNTYPSIESNTVPQKAVYITEIEDDFYLCDLTQDEESSQPVPLQSENLAEPSQPTNVTTLPTNNLPAENNVAPNSSLFTGKKSLLLGLGLGVFLTLGLTRLFLTPNVTSQGNSEPSVPIESATPAQTVTVTDVIATDVDKTLETTGTVTAYERTPVMSQAAGLQITAVLAERGDWVEQGQVLARLNNQALIAQKIEAEGAVAEAQSRLAELQAGNRAEEIAQGEARVINAESAVVKAQSDLELAQTRVESNQNLIEEGAITRDRLNELLNQEQVAESDFAGAKASLREAQQALAQLKAGSRPQIIAQAQAQLAQAQGRLKVIEAQLSDTNIVASSTGIIASREAKVGQITSTSDELFSIIQDGRLELNVKVSETLIGLIKPRQKVKVTSHGHSRLRFTGRVREIDPLIDDSSRQATVKIDLPRKANLKPGMFLKAAINTHTSQGTIVPSQALLPKSGNQATAFVLEADNTVRSRTVEMGQILTGQKVEVIGGLEAGDRIILKGAAYLKDGDKVTLSNDEI